MNSVFPRIYNGVRWMIVCDSYHGVIREAVSSVYAEMQRFLPYVLEVEIDGNIVRGFHLVVMQLSSGTLARSLIDQGLLDPPDCFGGFSIYIGKSLFGAEKMVVIVGFDEVGLLHGGHYFNAHVLSRHVYALRPEDLHLSLSELPELRIVESPRVQRRGIWTWGYPIGDFVSFLDNMSRLRMNSITVWNDVPPVNADDFIECAHARGIEVNFGFAWGWGTSLDIGRDSDVQMIKESVIEKYRREYSQLCFNGIYFQTLTEHRDLSRSGLSTARLACRLVNEIADALIRERSDIKLMFGVHAMSIGENFSDFESLDPRVSLVWEDAGMLPYLFSLEQNGDGQLKHASRLQGVSNQRETIEYSLRLAAIRGGNHEFALVPKGWCGIDWSHEFENHGQFIIGKNSLSRGRRQYERKRACWNVADQGWLRHFREASEFFRSIINLHRGNISVSALIEDGGFEHLIRPSVSLFSEMVWNPGLSDDELLCRAMSSYYINGYGA